MKKQNENVRIVAEAAIMAALAFVLDLLQGVIFDAVPFFANGGSVGIAMLPIIFIGIRRGPLIGFVSGLVTGILQMLTGFYAISDTWYKVLFQVLLDYTLAYAICGLFAGFFKYTLNKKGHGFNLTMILVAGFLGGVGKYLCHVLAGYFFWPSDMWGGPLAYSILYNGIYMLPSTILCMALLAVLFIRRSDFFFTNNNISDSEVKA